MPRELTAEERRAVAALERSLRRLPSSLRLVLLQSSGVLFVTDAAEARAADDLGTVDKLAVLSGAKVESFA